MGSSMHLDNFLKFLTLKYKKMIYFPFNFCDRLLKSKLYYRNQFYFIKSYHFQKDQKIGQILKIFYITDFIKFNICIIAI